MKLNEPIHVEDKGTQTHQLLNSTNIQFAKPNQTKSIQVSTIQLMTVIRFGLVQEKAIPNYFVC